MIKAIEISLIITAIYVCLSDGMVLSPIRVYVSNFLDKIGLELLKKPLFDCLICMGGIYSLILYPILFGLDIDMFKTMLIVIGINSLIDKY